MPTLPQILCYKIHKYCNSFTPHCNPTVYHLQMGKLRFKEERKKNPLDDTAK